VGDFRPASTSQKCERATPARSGRCEMAIPRASVSARMRSITRWWRCSASVCTGVLWLVLRCAAQPGGEGDALDQHRRQGHAWSDPRPRLLEGLRGEGIGRPNWRAFRSICDKEIEGGAASTLAFKRYSSPPDAASRSCRGAVFITIFINPTKMLLDASQGSSSLRARTAVTPRFCGGADVEHRAGQDGPASRGGLPARIEHKGFAVRCGASRKERDRKPLKLRGSAHFSTSSIPRRIHDPSTATFVRVPALTGFHLPRTRDPASLAPATPAPSGPRPPPHPRRTLRRSRCVLSGRHHRALRSAIQIP
jgi:hypothetical protein